MDKVIMPEELTAEIGAKDLMMGEFSILTDMGKTDNGARLTENIPIPWDVIKDIYKMAVKHYSKPIPASSPPPVTPERLAKILDALFDKVTEGDYQMEKDSTIECLAAELLKVVDIREKDLCSTCGKGKNDNPFCSNPFHLSKE